MSTPLSNTRILFFSLLTSPQTIANPSSSESRFIRVLWCLVTFYIIRFLWDVLSKLGMSQCVVLSLPCHHKPQTVGPKQEYPWLSFFKLLSVRSESVASILKSCHVIQALDPFEHFYHSATWKKMIERPITWRRQFVRFAAEHLNTVKLLILI